MIYNTISILVTCKTPPHVLTLHKQTATLCVEKTPPYVYCYDPWERVYVIKDNSVYRLGHNLYPENAEDVKRLLSAMSLHSLPTVPSDYIYHTVRSEAF